MTGDYLPGLTTTFIRLERDQCLVRLLKDGKRAVCVRESHPTPGSDCTTVDWIHHVSELDER